MPNVANPYTPQFYQKDLDTVLRSARQIVPRVMDLVAPKSVIDVGCGIGIWLSVFAEKGVGDYLGIDGEYVQRPMLRIPPDRFLPRDLSSPFTMDRQFDLVVSLEVGEHLPAMAAAGFVESLTRLGPAVLFSAAAPFQGGAHHVNEQWPDYWAELFEQLGYVTLDCIRRHVWQDVNVESWYAQNILLFVKADLLRDPRLQRERDQTTRTQLAMIHPRMYLEQHHRRLQREAAAEDLATVIEPGEKFVILDEEQLRTVIARGYRAIPFTQRDGVYWGPPESDEVAIRDIEALRAGGARHVVVTWPAFWWLAHYHGFARHLRGQYRTVLQNDRMIVFEM